MYQIKVTVIIPVYNMKMYLSECLESVISQTLKEIEIFCVNDGSTDSSLKILEEYKKKDNRIYIEDTNNNGPAYARNLGISKGRGKYVIFLDADDLYPTDDILETLYETAEKNNVLIAGGEFSLLKPDGTVIPADDFKEDELFYGYCFEKEGIMSYREYQYDYGYHRFIYNREFLLTNQIFFPDLRRFQDPPFMVEAMSKAELFWAIKKTTYMLRTGYKKIEWTNDRLIDLFKGLLSNLNFAEKEGYEKLFATTQLRIAKEYKEHLNGIVKYAAFTREEEKKVENSFSYKIGLVITFIPRKIWHAIKGT